MLTPFQTEREREMLQILCQRQEKKIQKCLKYFQYRGSQQLLIAVFGYEAVPQGKY